MEWADADVYSSNGLRHWMKQLKIDPEKCCKLTKKFLLNDLDEQLGMGKIYLQHKKKKLKALEYQVGMIIAQITNYDCEEFRGWIAHQLTSDEKVPSVIKQTALKWTECELNLMQEVRGEIRTKRSQHWERTGEML